MESESTAAQNVLEELPLEQAVHSQSLDVLERAALNPALTEDLALTLLKHPELPATVFEALSRNGALLKQRKVRLGVVVHPRTPRHISLPLLRQLYTFDLMHVTVTPIVPADVKKAAEEVLVTRLATSSLGEKLSLARRASGRIAEQLLLDKEPRIMETALENSRLTEASVVKVLMRAQGSATFVHAVCHHDKWSQRREIRIALLRNEDAAGESTGVRALAIDSNATGNLENIAASCQRQGMLAQEQSVNLSECRVCTGADARVSIVVVPSS